MEAVQSHRQAAQPVKARTGGSTFKNPPGTSAWKLIDAAGINAVISQGIYIVVSTIVIFLLHKNYSFRN